jgi:hypothetical protein
MEPLFLCQAMEERDREKNGRSTGRRLETTRQQQKRPLYGRSNEIAALQECWNHLVDTATPSQPDKNDGLMEKDKSSISRRRPRSNMHVLIVRGPFGVGMRALVQSTFQTPNLPAGATVPTGSGEQEDGDGGQFGAHVYLCGRVRPTAPKSDAAEITAGTVGNQSNQERGHQLSCPQCPKRNSLQAIFEMLEQLASSTVVDTATRKKIREHLVARSDLERNPLAQSLLTLLADSCEGERRPVEFNADSTNSSDQLLSGVMNPSFISRHGACLPYPTTHPKLSGTTKTIAQLVQLIRIIASCVPLVLHMEQFQYADAESVAFFDLLLDQSDPNSGKAKPACKGLLVVLSYEDEDVSDSDDCDDSADSEEPIESFFSRLEQRDRDDVTTIRLTNLTYYDVEQWTLDELQLQATTLSDDGQAMAKYLFESTRGNPQLLRYIWQYISLELTRNGQGEASIVLSWENAPFWNEIRRNVDNWLRCGTGTVCSSTELYLQIVRRQSSAIQKFIETMALIVECGVEDSVDPSILEMVLRIPCAEAIAMACDQGLLEVTLTG